MSTEKQREYWRKSNAKYKQTEKGKAASKRAEEVRRLNGNKLNYRQKYLASLKGRAYTLFNNAKQRAAKKHLPFSLTREWVEERLSKKECEVTGLPLTLVTEDTYDTGRVKPFSPCIDRIIPELGYTPENSRVVCCIFNTCKFNWTDEDVKTFVTAYYMKEIQN